MLLDRLAELLPPPSAVPPSDWVQVESALGTALPPDYKAFCDRWGPAGDIETSGPVSVYRLPEQAAESQEILGEELDDEDLLLWGETESECRLLWRTTGRPEDWEVVVLALDEPVATGLPFVGWLVAALEGRLPAAQVPPELEREDGDTPAAEWFPRGGQEDAEDEGPPRPEGVLLGFGSDLDDEDGPLVVRAQLDLGGVLNLPRTRVLEAFVAQLEPDVAAMVVAAEARADEEEITVRERESLRPVLLAAVAFAEVRLGTKADANLVELALAGA